MSIVIEDNEVNVNDLYRVCRKIATPKEIKKLDKIMLQLATAQDKTMNKYDQTSYKSLEGLSDEKTAAYTKNLNKSMKAFEKRIDKICNSKKTKDMKFSVRAKEGGMEYVEDEKGNKATTVVKSLLGKSMINTRKETMNTIAQNNKTRELNKSIDARNEQARQEEIEKNKKLGREEYNMGRATKERMAERKIDIQGEIAFNDYLAKETYGNEAAAYRVSKMSNEEPKKRLAELEGEVK